MKQEYHFTISRTDRICLISFVIILLGWELVKYAIPKPQHLIQTNPVAGEDKMDSTDAKKTSYTNQWKRENATIPGAAGNETNEDEDSDLTPVYIMEASAAELKSIGFSGKVAFNIEKYVAAGGVLKNEKDLLKIYGMDSLQLKAVSRWIIFPEPLVTGIPKSDGDNPNEVSVVKNKLDLNLATTVDLESLPGIGAILADRIIKYRNGLGGFVQMDQLMECYGLPPETFEKIKSQLEITTPPQHIPINEIDLTSFYHPYVDKKIIRILSSYRKQHGPFAGPLDLRKVYPPDTSWCDKILPYLIF